MGKFLDLLQGVNLVEDRTEYSALLFLSPWKIGAWQIEVAKRFPLLVASSSLNYWEPGDPIPAYGLRVLVGVATFSVKDMNILDNLENYMSEADQQLHIDVFNVAQYEHCDIEKYIPSLGQVFQTPIVGIWSNQTLIDKAWGYEATKLLALHFGVSILSQNNDA